MNYRYLASFSPGFEAIIPLVLETMVNNTGKIKVLSGLVIFSSTSDPEKIALIPVFNNIFLIIKEWNTRSSQFTAMVTSVMQSNVLDSFNSCISSFNQKTFRVRFSKENQFVSVDKKIMKQIEDHICLSTNLIPDRLNPIAEFWFLTRTEPYSFFLFRLTKKPSTEKYLHKGELRPEIVELIIAMAKIKPSDTRILDPFAGYGSIPARLLVHAQDKKINIYAFDNSQAQYDYLIERFGKNKLTIRLEDACSLSSLQDESIDLIITDPPWGDWDVSLKTQQNLQDFYIAMLASFFRVLAMGGRACILTGAKQEMSEAIQKSKFSESCKNKEYRTDILVNGKKAAVFIITKGVF